MELDVGLATLTSLLALDEFEVVGSAWDRQLKIRRLTLVPRTAVAICPHCHRASDQRHARHERIIADLPMGDQRVELLVHLWQYHCGACRKFFAARFAALAEGAHATERLLERLADLAAHSDIAHAARFFVIPEKTASGWYYAYVERVRRTPAPDLKPVRSLGIDELSIKKDAVNSVAC
jgi:transposase